MDISTLLSLGQTALELGLTCSLTALALYLSYTMLNVCDLSTDGCFTLGAVTGAVTAMAGHPVLAIFAAMAAGLLSGLIVDRVITQGHVDELTRLCVMMLVLTVVRVGSRYGCQMWMERFGQNSIYRLVSD